MIDEEVITGRIAKIREYGRLLANLLQTPRDKFVQEPVYYLQAERLLEVMIQAMIDIGNHVIAGLLLKKPEDYRQIFDILAQNHIISEELLPKVRALVGLRNLLVHEYFEVDHSRLYDEARAGLADFEEFCKAIVHFLQNHSA